jgi:hypothetical protein
VSNPWKPIRLGIVKRKVLNVVQLAGLSWAQEGAMVSCRHFRLVD